MILSINRRKLSWKIIFIFTILLSSLNGVPSPQSFASTETENKPPKDITIEAKITEVRGSTIEMEIISGERNGQDIVVIQDNFSPEPQQKYKKGDSVIVTETKFPDGRVEVRITDYARTKPLLILFILFLALTVIIGKIRGALSLLGMALSFLTIFYFVLPNILKGNDPVFISIIASAIIIPVNFYLSHGVNKKTTVAIVSTVLTLFLTSILAKFFTEITHLSGLASEEAAYLKMLKDELLDIRGLLLSGVIIGVLGILDDITISQSAIAFQLKESRPDIGAKELFSRVMGIGKDHIASLVNTLILVYAGASLPLLLLFTDTSKTFGEVVNFEIIAEEIVRMLVGSIGLILAVPITSLLAILALKNKSG